LKGALLIALAFGFLKFLHRDVGDVVEGLANKLRVDPDNRYLGALLAKLNLLDDKRLRSLSALTFAYSALFLTEGTGLFFEKRWAEFLTIIATASFIPLELYELIKDPSLARSFFLALNAGIVVFLIVNLRRRKWSESAGMWSVFTSAWTANDTVDRAQRREADHARPSFSPDSFRLANPRRAGQGKACSRVTKIVCSHHANHPANYPNPSFDWCLSSVAIQHGVGLLPGWRYRARPADRVDLGRRGAHLTKRLSAFREY
jgi:uncharacterized membrane protein (DUF2068 family)